MKLGKEAKKFAIDFTQDIMNSMPESLIGDWSQTLMDAYCKVIELGDTNAIALMITMLHQSLDFEQYHLLKPVLNDCVETAFIENTLTYETSNKMDEVLK